MLTLRLTCVNYQWPQQVFVARTIVAVDLDRSEPTMNALKGRFRKICHRNSSHHEFGEIIVFFVLFVKEGV